MNREDLIKKLSELTCKEVYVITPDHMFLNIEGISERYCGEEVFIETSEIEN
jgi:hypothetical protein